MCSVTGESGGSSSGGEGAAGGAAGACEAVRTNARSVVSQYLQLSHEVDELKRRMTAKRKERDGLESAVKGAMSDLQRDSLQVENLGGVDLVQTRRKAVARVEDFMRILHAIDAGVAASVKEAVDQRRQVVEKEVLKVIKPRA